MKSLGMVVCSVLTVLGLALGGCGDDSDSPAAVARQDSGGTAGETADNGVPPADLQPAGTWRFEATGEALGFGFYPGSDEPQGGDLVDVEDYDLDIEPNDSFDETITYDPATGTATLTAVDPDHGLTGDVDLDSEGVGAAGLGEPETLELSDGCDATITDSVVFIFEDSETAILGLRQEAAFKTTAGPVPCDAFLNQIASAIRNGNAPPIWDALNDSGAIDLSKISQLEATIIALIYEGQKLGSTSTGSASSAVNRQSSTMDLMGLAKTGSGLLQGPKRRRIF